MLKSSGQAEAYRYGLRKLSFTGEPMDSATRAFVEATFGAPVCSMYGTTEVGVILADYPGAADYTVKPERSASRSPAFASKCRARTVGPVRRTRSRDQGVATRCLVSDEGSRPRGRQWLLLPRGRADDVIISAG